MFIAALCNKGGGGVGGEGEDSGGPSYLKSREVDDLRLVIALLHKNVDKFIANKIMITFSGK